MKRIYDYLGFEVEVSVEAHPGPADTGQLHCGHGYVAIVTITKAGQPVSCFAPLRLGEADGRPFRNKPDALMGGFSAGRCLIDDLGNPDRS
ncbi:hypothetical protein PPGU19_089520 (plasmid) [Paraburkholderia sp. PGU19]|uniref:hypothetical protein n=1 Tax=Paraburkholderia sp. PGU19 TaxID=2735434 RepID=UPI0015DAA54F|nr:hypothetical protein [Paraburkholderia sp. PGU19]BCG04384.1 hypothetical protein PPGU19_089520 [Paraburkholderia sp. PGU19]